MKRENIKIKIKYISKLNNILIYYLQVIVYDLFL